MSDKIIAVLAMVSLVGNIWLAWSWRRATAQALLSETYLKLLRSTSKRLGAFATALDRKEKHVRALEKELVEHLGDDELVERLNRLFSKATGGSGAFKLPDPNPPGKTGN